MDNSNREELTPATLSALKWSYAGTAVRVIAQMLIGIVLARLLGPEPFGLVAVAWLVISLGNLIADFGFGAAIVQRQTISEEEVRYAFTIQLLIGLGLTLIVASSASLIAQIFKQQQLMLVMRVLSLIFVVQSLSQTSISLLKRDLDFKGIQLAQVLSYMISFLAMGIPLAYLGFGVWSLVIAQLSQSLLFTILTYFRVRHPVKPLFKFSAGLVNFGSKVIGTNIFNWAIQSMDTVFIGRLFGAASLGLYNRAFTLMASPMNNIVAVLQGVLFPAYSRAQGETDTIKRVYLASVGVISMVMLPVFGSIAVVPHTIIESLYGSRWLGAAPLLVPLALAMPFHAIMALAGPLIWGEGKVGKELRIQAVVAVLFLAVLFATARISLITLAWGVFGIYFVRFFLMTWAVLRVVDASWSRLLATLRGSVMLLVGTVLAVMGADAAMLSHNLPSLIRLFSDVLAASITTCLLFLIFPRYLVTEEIVWLLGRVSNRMPGVFRSLLGRAQLVKT